MIAIACGIASLCEWRAVVADAHRAPAPKAMTTQMCQSCHSDPKMLAAMKEKQGIGNTAPVYLTTGVAAEHSPHAPVGP